MRLRPEHAGHVPVDTTKRVPLVVHVDDLLLAGTHQVIKKIFTELSRDLELKTSEVTTKPTRYVGRTLVQKEWYNFGVDASYVGSMLEEFNMSALKSSPPLHRDWEQVEERCACKRTKSLRTARWKTVVD